MNLPVTGEHRQLINLSAAIAKSIDHLADELDAETGRSRQELVDEARSLAAVAHDLNGVLSGRPSAEAEQRSFKELLDSWTVFHGKLNSLRGERFNDSQDLAAQLVTDIKRLEKQLRD